MSNEKQKLIELVECPRDAMQGWKTLLSTEEKVSYLNQLLKVGFHTLDLGSFVSPKAIPQMADTEEVLNRLNRSSVHSRLLVIAANERGAEKACTFEQVDDIGFPFSVSETFQLRNTNSTIADSFERVKAIRHLCKQANKRLVVYLSMGFGNPYGDPWNEEIVFHWAEKLVENGIEVLSLADTVGLATAEQVSKLTTYLINQLPGVNIGVHLHSSIVNRAEKLGAAYLSGCRRFDGALKGVGGCPMADDELVGNMDTEWMIRFFEKKGEQLSLNHSELNKAVAMAGNLFG